MSAIKGQGSIIAVGSALSGSAINITAATKASPCVLTTSVMAFATNDIVVVTGIVGMTELNDRAFVVDTSASPSTKKATLQGVDSTAYTTYGSGGTAQKYTMSNVGTVKSIKGFDGQSSKIDSTHLLSRAKQFLLGLQDFGAVTIELLMDNTDTGQQYLRTAKSQQLIVPFSVTLSNGDTAAFLAGVEQFSFDGAEPDGVMAGSVSLIVSNEPAWFA